MMVSAPSKLFPVLAFIAISFFSSHSFAYSAVGTASVNLLESVNFEEKKTVDYGSIINQNGNCSIAAGGELVGSNGSNCSGNGQLGEFVISGTSDQTVSIDVTAGESVSGVTFTPELHTQSSAVLIGGSTVAKVGGTLNLNNASQGFHALTYTISVNYN